jgi:transposase
MTERLEQRYCIKFCQKLGDSQVETIRKIHTVFGDDAMGITQIKEWYNRFKDGRTSVESEPRSGRPSTCRNDQVIAKVNAVVMRDRRLTIREIAEEVGVSTFSAHSIVTEDLAMKRVSAKFVPKLLTAEQKQLRVEVSQDMLDSTNSDPDFLNTIITGDESWVYGYDPETKSQSSQWKHSSSPRPKKARQVRSNVKVMLTAFFDSRGVVHHEYAPQGQTINKEYYRDVLRRLRDAVRRKRPDLWSTGNWRLHHDNAPAHSSHLIQTFFGKKPDSCASTGSLLS